MVNWQDCHRATLEYHPNKCREGWLLYRGTCYFLSERPQTYVQAEVDCLTMSEKGRVSKLTWSAKANHLAYLARLAGERHGSSELWIGADGRRGGWESRSVQWEKQCSCGQIWTHTIFGTGIKQHWLSLGWEVHGYIRANEQSSKT